eukprot:212874_1
MQTKVIKEMKAADRENELHYDIKKDDPIRKEHVMSVILYTDWSDLCTSFSNTFRKEELHHPLYKIKTKNAEYGNWSKLLRETIEYYGCSGEGVWDEEKEKFIDKLTGPFFCGISRVMAIGSFNMRLCGPTSTSIHIEVGIRFSGDDGTILQFNNNGDHNSKTLRAFNCCWLSNYSGEQEYLFMGGFIRMRLESVRIQNTSQNFNEQIESLFYLDCMLNGTWMDKEFNKNQIHKNKCAELLNHLIKYQTSDKKLKLQTTDKKLPYPLYVYNVFESFCILKTQIVINLDEINGNFMALRNVILNQETMLFREILFDLFLNLERVIIYSTSPDGKKEYKFDWGELKKLLGSAKAPNGFRILIYARSEYDRYLTDPQKCKVQSWIKQQLPTIAEWFGANKYKFTSKIIGEQYRDKLELRS